LSAQTLSMLAPLLPLPLAVHRVLMQDG